jgi:hypothetical protein
VILLLACTIDNGFTEPTDNVEPIDLPDELLKPWAIAGQGDRVKRWEFLTLDGTESWDPDDEDAELLYSWYVIDSPQGSAPALADEFTANPAFGADLLGTYTVALTVTDLDDLESGNNAYTAVEVIPWEDLEVALEWKVVDVDFDLHLVEDTSSYFGSGDCFFGNPNPDWGDAGNDLDNPQLDGDSEGASDAEIITLSNPEEREYDVYVTLWNTQASSTNVDKPKLVIHGDGVELYNDFGPNMKEGEVWYAGTISWPDLAFTPVGELTTHALLGGPTYND